MLENPELQKQIEVEAARHEIATGQDELMRYNELLAFAQER
jgi:hypothetical protein